jgi:hypothetical protein
VRGSDQAVRGSSEDFPKSTSHARAGPLWTICTLDHYQSTNWQVSK